MNYSEDYISNFGKQTGFINSNIEKVIRLLDILAFINSDLDPYYEKFVLKGGTAINLMITNLARLSVDIDLDKHGNKVYSKIVKGNEIWVHTRNGIIQNGGSNGRDYKYHNIGGKK